jgi:hypothetical protein
MNDYLSRFNNAPASFKKSFIMLVGAWCCHPVFVYSLFEGGGMLESSTKDIMKMAVVSLCLCALLFSIKKWARALVVVGNVFIVVNDLFYFLVVPRNKLSTLLCVMVVLFTSIGTYWLFRQDSRDYYTRVNPKKEPVEPSDPKQGPYRPGK